MWSSVLTEIRHLELKEEKKNHWENCVIWPKLLEASDYLFSPRCVHMSVRGGIVLKKTVIAMLPASKPHWSFSISRQLGQKRGEAWVQMWRCGGLPYAIRYPASSSSEPCYFTMRFSRATEILHEAGCWTADLLCWRNTTVLTPAQVTVAGPEVLLGKAEGGFHFFCGVM